MTFKPLRAYAASTYSQFGEDGIVGEILKRLASVVDLDRWCAEFGAWDGVYLSNTCKLIREESYNAVLIEGDAERVGELTRNFPQSNVVKICRFVNFEGPDSLDNVFSETPIPQNFDFLTKSRSRAPWPLIGHRSPGNSGRTEIPGASISHQQGYPFDWPQRI